MALETPDVLDILDIENDDTPDMSHIVDEDRSGGNWSLCGARLNLFRNYYTEEDVDCVVCEDIWKVRHG